MLEMFGNSGAWQEVRRTVPPLCQCLFAIMSSVAVCLWSCYSVRVTHALPVLGLCSADTIQTPVMVRVAADQD